MQLNLQISKILLLFFLSVSINAYDLNGQCNTYRTEAEATSNRSNGVRNTSCSEGGQRIKDFKRGATVEYRNLQFPRTGRYIFKFRVSTPRSNQKVQIFIDKDFSGEFKAERTGNWNRNWQTQEASSTIYVTAGTHRVTFQSDGRDGVSINWWEYKLAGCTTECDPDPSIVRSPFSKKNQFNFTSKFMPKDLSGITHIEFQFKSGAVLLGKESRIELTSSGTHDKAEYSVPFTDVAFFITGDEWYTVRVPFTTKRAAITRGGENPDITRINYLRFYVNGEPNSYYQVQNVKAIIDCKLARGRNAPRLEFDAHAVQQVIKLEWLTNSGYRVNTFEVEHSADGENFQQINSQPNETDNDEMEYHYTTHSQPQQGTNYYRVKEIYFDGSYKYTDVQKVGFEIDLNKINIFPNPVKDNLHISMRPYLGKKGSLTLLNQFGQIVKELNLAEIQADLLQLNTSELENGMYFLNVAIENQRVFTEKVLVNRLY